MIIYDAILNKKRVMFYAGKGISAQQLSQFVCAAGLLVSPPIYGILQRIFPFCSWNDLYFLNCNGYIAGVKNPLFKTRNNWYDIFCDIETGQIIGKIEDYSLQKYFKEDCDFIEIVFCIVC